MSQIFCYRHPEYRGLTKIPKAFWKVAVMVGSAGEGLVATGYVLSQASLVAKLSREFAFGPYRTFQVPLARIERWAKLRFDASLTAADPMKQEGVAGARTVHEFEDIVLR